MNQPNLRCPFSLVWVIIKLHQPPVDVGRSKDSLDPFCEESVHTCGGVGVDWGGAAGS